MPQLGFDPSHRNLRFLHTTQAIRFGRGTSAAAAAAAAAAPSLVLGLEELPMFMSNGPRSIGVDRSLVFIPVCVGGEGGEM